MAYFDSLPFQRGDTYEITAATDGAYLLGNEYIVEDKDPSDTMKKRSNRLVHLRVVRNGGAIALLPKRIVRYETSTAHTEVDGYTTTTAQYFAGVVDEFLPAAGLAVNDIGYIVIKGPTLCLTPLSNFGADVAQDGILVAITGATSGSTTSGRVQNTDLTGATALLAEQVINRLGRAMSVVLTSATNSNILVDVRCDY